MEVKILCPFWGHEHVAIPDFLKKITDAGFDGIETWLPATALEKCALNDHVQKHQMELVVHQHEAEGSTFAAFNASYRTNLYRCAKLHPILINSHTGRDWFSQQQNLALIDTALEFTAKTGIHVAHETHRGRLGFCPQMMQYFFAERSEMHVTADFSHWVCVTESMLQNFQSEINEVIFRARHIHARVGFEQGPQVPHPAAPEWQYALEKHLEWWDRIILHNKSAQREIFTITTEFGPPPYMPLVPFDNIPVADQFEINVFMKNLLKKRYSKD